MIDGTVIRDGHPACESDGVLTDDAMGRGLRMALADAMEYGNTRTPDRLRAALRTFSGARSFTDGENHCDAPNGGRRLSRESPIRSQRHTQAHLEDQPLERDRWALASGMSCPVPGRRYA
jgi:hypothetical protein